MILGFNVVRDETPGDKYLVLKFEENILCFWGGDERIYQHGFFKKVKGKVKVVADLKIRPWGVKDFRIEDPNGFYLRFSEPHNVLEVKETLSSRF